MEALALAWLFVCLSGCLLSVYACYRHVSAANDVAHDLRSTRARVIAAEAYGTALEGQHEKLLGRLKTLEGRFYATRGPIAEESQTVTPMKRVDAEPACENWLQAQVDGPRSVAASCECDFCVRQREQRAREKAAILALHAKGAPRPRSNGSE